MITSTCANPSGLCLLPCCKYNKQSHQAQNLLIAAIVLRLLTLTCCCAFSNSNLLNHILCHRSQVGSSTRLTIFKTFPPEKQDAIESELNQALVLARDVDKQHGLCTGPSQKAWDVVDELYHQIQSLSDTGSGATLATQASPGQSTKRRMGLCTSKVVTSDEDMEGMRYFF